jgi:AP-2 complex subunit alpha
LNSLLLSRNFHFLTLVVDVVVEALQDPDISIRRRALDLLYGMCNRKTSKVIVLELLGYLQSLNINISADFAIREELVSTSLFISSLFQTHNYLFF